MKAWRGIPMLVSVVLGGFMGMGCGASSGERDMGVVGGEAAMTLETQGPVPVEPPTARRECGPDRVGPPGSKPEWLARGDRRLFFSAEGEGQGRELWSSPGNAECADVVKDIRPGPMGSVPRFLTPVGKWVLFVADDGLHGPELWRTDGTAAGTVMVKDVWKGERGSAPRALTRVGNWLYFIAEDFEHGQELWRTDGTDEGTRLMHEFQPGTASHQLTGLTAWGDRLALVAYSDDAAVLWSVDSDGVARAHYRSSVGVFFSLTAAGRRLFFLRDAGTSVAELWVTTDRPGSAMKVRDFSGEIPSYLTAMNGMLFFVAGSDGYFGEKGDTRHGGELWRSDGTTVGTRLVRDIWPGPKGSLPSSLVVMDGVLYFAAEDGWRGRELWRSDGSALGTWMVWDIEWGAKGSDPEHLVAENDWLFFSATTSGFGREVWTSDGWLWRTRRLTDIAPGTSSSDPRSFVRAGNEVFFLAGDVPMNEALWAVPFRPAWPCAQQGARDAQGCQ
ncbi:ELWxxDGT repeat protein [Myxococcus stipitatus]|uniref:ELWxxDGT repeat protein n=1 Tax=Myxococcus stipitatus TaxID=83455 RepID=UPI0030CC608E